MAESGNRKSGRILSFAIGDEHFDLDVGADMRIDPHDLQSSFVKLASTRTFYALLHRRIERQAQKLDDTLEVWMAAAREEARAKSPKGRTEGSVTDAVKSDPEYANQLAELRYVRFVEKSLRDCVSGFDAMRDMLMKLGKRQAEDEAGAESHPPRTRRRDMS